MHQKENVMVRGREGGTVADSHMLLCWKAIAYVETETCQNLIINVLACGSLAVCMVGDLEQGAGKIDTDFCSSTLGCIARRTIYVQQCNIRRSSPLCAEHQSNALPTLKHNCPPGIPMHPLSSPLNNARAQIHVVAQATNLSRC